MSWNVSHQHGNTARSYGFDTQAEAEAHAQEIRQGTGSEITADARKRVVVYELPDADLITVSEVPC